MTDIEKINMVLWVIFFVFVLITWLVRKVQVNAWGNEIDNKVVSDIPFRPLQTRDKNIFFEGVLYVFFFIDVFLGVIAIMTIPAPF